MRHNRWAGPPRKWLYTNKLYIISLTAGQWDVLQKFLQTHIFFCNFLRSLAAVFVRFSWSFFLRDQYSGGAAWHRAQICLFFLEPSHCQQSDPSANTATLSRWDKDKDKVFFSKYCKYCHAPYGLYEVLRMRNQDLANFKDVSNNFLLNCRKSK